MRTGFLFSQSCFLTLWGVSAVTPVTNTRRGSETAQPLPRCWAPRLQKGHCPLARLVGWWGDVLLGAPSIRAPSAGKSPHVGMLRGSEACPDPGLQRCL